MSQSEQDQLRDIVAHITGCQSSLYAYICSLLGSGKGAADVLQETNIVLWEKASEYDRARPFLPWAYGIAWYQVLAYRKRMSREKLLFDDEMLRQVSDSFTSRGDQMDRELEALDGCMEKLPQRHRDVVNARYRDNQSLDAIARGAGKAANAVAAELYRIRKSLLDCVRATLAKEQQP